MVKQRSAGRIIAPIAELPLVMPGKSVVKPSRGDLDAGGLGFG
jgi:hypothetical protein